MKRIFLLVLFILIVAPLLVGGYFGLIPGLSTVFGADKPRDLQVVASEQALNSASDKTQVEVIAQTADNLAEGEASASQTLRYEGSHPATMTLSSEELTSMAQNSRWQFNPFSQLQIRINPDGSGEASGYIDFAAAVNYVKAFGVSQADIDAALAKFPIPQTKFPFYLALTGEVSDNQISANVSKLELARIPVPTGIVNQYLEPATSFVEQNYLNGQAVSVNKLENREGQVYFDGTLPDKEVAVGR